MSRYTIQSLNPQQHSVRVGWDAPLMTFFAQVFDLTIEDDDEDDLIFWIGTKLCEIQSVDHLQQAIAQYTTIDPETVALLENDFNQAYAPTPFQNQMREFTQRLSQPDIASPLIDPALTPTVGDLANRVEYATRSQLEPYNDGQRYWVLIDPALSLSEIAWAALHQPGYVLCQSQAGLIQSTISLSHLPGDDFWSISLGDAYWLCPHPNGKH